jgi:hypothetical protein
MLLQVWPGRWLGKARPWSGWAWACWTPLAPAGQRSRPPARSTPSGTHPQIRHTCCVVAVTPCRRVEATSRHLCGSPSSSRSYSVGLLATYSASKHIFTSFPLWPVLSWGCWLLTSDICEFTNRRYWPMRTKGNRKRGPVADDIPFFKVSALADRCRYRTIFYSPYFFIEHVTYVLTQVLEHFGKVRIIVSSLLYIPMRYRYGRPEEKTVHFTYASASQFISSYLFSFGWFMDLIAVACG